MRHFSSLIVATLALCMIAVAPAARGQSAGQSMDPATLDKLLAPIALYPDALVLQVVQCATSPYQVKQVNDWLKQNPDLKGTAVQAAAQQQGFDENFIAIVLFPQVLQMLADKPDWTQQLGNAFTTDRDGVLASVQRLREEAQAAGNLKTTEQQTVTTQTVEGGQQVIVIQPANPQVVYVPQYNPEVVYVQQAPSNNSVAAAAVIGFTAGVIVGALADNDHDHFYYSCGGWGYHGAVMYSGGYNNYYHHREDMANDYYDHRENMAQQRGDNMNDRRDDFSGNSSDRQGNRSDNQGARQGNRSDNQGSRQGNRSDNQGSRQDTRSGNQDARTGNQSDRQSSRSQNQSSRQSTRGTTSSRGAAQNRTQPSTATRGTNSGAFSGYQRGSTERQSSDRGRSSMSSSSRSSGSRSSGSRSGGGRSGGGGRRR